MPALRPDDRKGAVGGVVVLPQALLQLLHPGLGGALLLPGVFGLGADGVYWSEPISDLLGGGAAFTTLMLTVYRPLAKELKEETLCQN